MSDVAQLPQKYSLTLDNSKTRVRPQPEPVLFSLKHFGRLSHSCIKTHQNTVF